MGRESWVAPQVRRLFERGSLSGLSERDVLDRFTRDGDPEAFRCLVDRHGPMVYGVCRRILADPGDVDDAFQAVFLVLLRRAGGLGRDVTLAAWLHGVASRVALRARSDRGRRSRRESTGEDLNALAGRDEPVDDLRDVLDREIDRLPARYRSPIILTYLEGLTHEEAARRLGWPLGTVKGRLARARDLLGSRLRRRGLDPAAGLAMAGRISEGVPKSLAWNLVNQAGNVVGLRTGVYAVAANVSRLVRGASTSMLLDQLKVAAMIIVASSGLGMGLGGMVLQSGGSSPPPQAGSASAKSGRTPKVPPTAAPKIPRHEPSPRILAALEKPISFHFPEGTELSVVLKYIRSETEKRGDGKPEWYGIPIYVDPAGLARSNASISSAVCLNSDGKPLRDGLQAILDQVELRYFVSEGFLTITSKMSRGSTLEELEDDARRLEEELRR